LIAVVFLGSWALVSLEAMLSTAQIIQLSGRELLGLQGYLMLIRRFYHLTWQRSFVKLLV
jgi:hypothetical protein